MRRRAFILALAGAAAWPLAVRAQQPERIRRIGVLMPFPADDVLARANVTALVQGLDRLGWTQGKNIRIDYRFGANDPTLLKAGASELVGLSPDAILASTPAAVEALRQETRTVPIVFVLVIDPVGLGFVQSIPRPGGNMTGFTAYEGPLMGKWLQLLKEVAPSLTRVAVIFNPDTARIYAKLFIDGIEAAAPSFGITVTLAPVHDDVEIEQICSMHARQPGGGLVSLPDTFTASHRDAISAAASRHSLPLMAAGAQFPRAGALMSYWFDQADQHAQAASYIDRILKGDSPANLPVQDPTKYSLVINLRTARALGVTFPITLLGRADEVIE
jgi:putative ABC transport system substrate-binding protein